MTTFQKIIKYLTMSLAIVLSVCIIGGIGSIMFSIFYLVNTEDALGEMQEYILEGEVDIIKIDISTVDFDIKTGDKFKIETNNDYITHNHNSNCLEIYESKKFINSISAGTKLTLYVPSDKLFEYAYIKTGAGKVSMDTLSAKAIDFDLGVGEVTANKIEAVTKADITSGVGEVTIRDGHFNNLNMNMGVGELNLTSRIEGNSRVQYGVGETNITLLGNDDEYCIDFENDIGKSNVSGRNLNGNCVYGNGNNHIEIDGGVGELNIDFLADEIL